MKKLLFILLFLNFAFGFESIEVLNPNITIHKSGYFKTDKDLSPKEAFEFGKHNTNITPLPQDAYSFGISKDTFWFVFELSTNGNEKLFFDSRDIFIETSYDLFVFQNNQLTKISKNGFVIPPELRDVKTKMIRFELLQNSPKTIYLLRAKSPHPLIPAFSFGNES